MSRDEHQPKHVTAFSQTTQNENSEAAPLQISPFSWLEMKNRKHASLRTFNKTCALGGQKCEETRQLSGQPMQNEHQIFPNSFTGKCCLDLT